VYSAARKNRRSFLVNPTALAPLLSLPQPVLTTLEWFKKTDGRDKLYRFVQYFSKYVIQVLKEHGADKDIIERLNKGASAVGLTRKLLRFFRAAEYTQEFLKAFDIKDDVEKYGSLAKSFFLALWMVCDHIQWLNKVGYLKLGATPKIDEWHSKGWLFGLLIGVLITLYKLRIVLTSLADANSIAYRAAQDSNPSALKDANKQINEQTDKRNKLYMSFIKGSVDAVIPAQRLAWLPVSDGTVGLAGAITSVIGAYDTWPAAKKA